MPTSGHPISSDSCYPPHNVGGPRFSTQLVERTQDAQTRGRTRGRAQARTHEVTARTERPPPLGVGSPCGQAPLLIHAPSTPTAET